KRSFIGPRVFEEVAHLADGRDSACQIEIDAAQEFGIVGERRGRHAIGLPRRLDVSVDLRREFPRIGLLLNRLNGAGARSELKQKSGTDFVPWRLAESHDPSGS